jgi:hypothetical protein
MTMNFKIFDIDKKRFDGPVTIIPGFFCFMGGALMESEFWLIVGLIFFTLCCIQMIFRPSYSDIGIDIAMGGVGLFLMILTSTAIILESFYGTEYVRSVALNISIPSAIFTIALCIIAHKEIAKLEANKWNMH